MTFWLTVLNCSSMLFWPVWMIFFHQLSPFFGLSALFMASVYILKMVSYAHVCKATRDLKRNVKDKDFEEALLGALDILGNIVYNCRESAGFWQAKHGHKTAAA